MKIGESTSRPRILRAYTLLERGIVVALLLLLLAVVLLATWQIGAETVRRLWYVAIGQPLGLASAAEFLHQFGALREIFGAVLLVLIGVELMRTLVIYLQQHDLHVEVVFTVAMIAIARHAVDLDLEEVEPLRLVGIGVMIFALTVGYYIYRRTLRDDAKSEPGGGASGKS
jgi:uncharacterized membrane protein (DUF373 family)